MHPHLVHGNECNKKIQLSAGAFALVPTVLRGNAETEFEVEIRGQEVQREKEVVHLTKS
jgi:hypothetical protein